MTCEEKSPGFCPDSRSTYDSVWTSLWTVFPNQKTDTKMRHTKIEQKWLAFQNINEPKHRKTLTCHELILVILHSRFRPQYSSCTWQINDCLFTWSNHHPSSNWVSCKQYSHERSKWKPKGTAGPALLLFRSVNSSSLPPEMIVMKRVKKDSNAWQRVLD